MLYIVWSKENNVRFYVRLNTSRTGISGWMSNKSDATLMPLYQAKQWAKTVNGIFTKAV